MDRKLAGVSVETYEYCEYATVFAVFSICYIFGIQTVALKPKLVLLFYIHAYATSKNLK